MTRSGGAGARSRWATTHTRTRRSADTSDLGHRKLDSTVQTTSIPLTHGVERCSLALQFWRLASAAGSFVGIVAHEPIHGVRCTARLRVNEGMDAH